MNYENMRFPVRMVRFEDHEVHCDQRSIRVFSERSSTIVPRSALVPRKDGSKQAPGLR